MRFINKTFFGTVFYSSFYFFIFSSTIVIILIYLLLQQFNRIYNIDHNQQINKINQFLNNKLKQKITLVELIKIKDNLNQINNLVKVDLTPATKNLIFLQKNQALHQKKLVKTSFGYYYLYLSSKNNKQNKNFFINNQNIFSLYLILIACSFFLAYWLSFILNKPIEQVRKSINDFKQNKAKKIFITTKIDNLNYIIAFFNKNIEKITNVIEAKKKQQNQLKQIIRLLNEGLVIIDEYNEINFFNDKFLNIIKQNNQILNTNLFEYISSNRLLNKVKQFKKFNKLLDFEINIFDKIYIVNLSFIDELNKDIMLIFTDISQIKYSIEDRKVFIDNASHELKTPLTIINGYLELLKNTKLTNNQKQYLEIINKNTQRMINITHDLLSLSKLNSINLQKKLVNIDNLITNVISIFEDKLKNKKLLLKTKLQTNKSLELDIYLIEQALINIIDNAIKYSEQGTILISTEQITEKTIIKIKDEGIGIAKTQQDKVFKRFYVVNKSRSRNFGGTGLGLSIVKQIIHKHKGNINIESKLKEGTTIIIKLPN